MVTTPAAASRRPSTQPLRLLAALVLLLPISATTVPDAAPAEPADGASTPSLPADVTVLHVDVDPDAPVTRPTGSRTRPYPTISRAVRHAQHLRFRGEPVRIVVAPGTYRESIRIRSAGGNPPLVLESEVPGAAVVSGGSRATRWQRVSDTDRFWTPWYHNWGLAPVPDSWGDVDVPVGVRRREAVRVDGAPLRQVLSPNAMTAGTFWVDEEGDRLVMQPPATFDPSHQQVEVARRPRLLRVHGNAEHVTVRGFTFEASATPLTGHMAYVSNSTDVTIEDNTFRHSSWGGLGVCCTDGITVRDNRALHNGGNGIDTYRAHDALVEGNTIRGNNVRGSRHGYTGWSVAGSKHLRLHGAVFRDNVYTANGARGLWFDTDVRNVLVDGDRSCGNLHAGAFVEAVQGPLVIRDSTFCDNPGGGILVATSGNVTLEDTTVANNGTGQLIFSGTRQRTWTDHATGRTITMDDFDNWTLTRSTLQSNDTTPLIHSPVIPPDEWQDQVAAGELTATDTAWARPSLHDAIHIQTARFSTDSIRDRRRPADDDASGADSGTCGLFSDTPAGRPLC